MSVTVSIPRTPAIRARLEQAIESLIALLDAIDGDPDLEDMGDAEPEETDQDGDEGDYSMSEDDCTSLQSYGFMPGTIAGGQGL